LIRRGAGALAALAVLVSVPGCGLLGFERERRALEKNVAWLSGSVSDEQPTDAPVVVLVLEVLDGRKLSLTNQVYVYGGGTYRTLVESREYVIAAFEDANENLVFEPGERWSFHADGNGVRPRGDVSGLDIVLPATAPPFSRSGVEIVEMDPAGNLELALYAVGKQVDFDDPRLSREVGHLGLMKPLEYLERGEPGIYFLEEYDPRKTPVVMIHGINGSPAEFRTLVEGRPDDDEGPGFAGIDRARYQPWLVSYPSSFPLRIVADALHLWVSLARAKYGPERILLVAHSMGGLATRAFLNEHVVEGRAGGIGVFVAIATPWGGNPAASMGLRVSPIVIWSWRDVATGSPFLATLFDTPLPEDLPFHLIFPYPHRTPETTTLPSGDGVAGFNSLVERRAVQEASSVHVLEGEHTSILHGPELVATLGAIFDEATRQGR